ncbi:hypothetical protein QN372_05495 [Undibacterium sp. RTI2.1]|uniref:hypothetical protein n=1 Tax=unclassified Undibacterium TaxID=2630295 RepID=UPI002B23C80F|nr:MULTISPECIES: hypothetical protein [unclassified Undibacterium]MEB0030192.1 hypothetical protein [Undibacterium sp. RTI2.1]MEB0116816.1 hypothetical protein [Undibacterium sp. RTI2.2]
MNKNAKFQFTSLTSTIGDSTRFPLVKLTVPQKLALLVAISATFASLGIATYTGWQSGGFLIERLIRIALIGVAVLFVHWLPAGAHELRGLVRVAAFTLWLVATLVVLHGQITFFMFSQRHAGDLRVAMVQTPSVPLMTSSPSGRSRADIAKEKTKVIADLARAQVQRCLGDCPTLNVRRARLTAETMALDAEADEAKRYEAMDDRRNSQVDRVDELRASLRADPVAFSVATWIGVTEQCLVMMIGLAYAVVLEGTAVLGWIMVPVALGRAAGRNEVISDSTLGVLEHEPAAEIDSNRGVISNDDKLVERVRAAVVAGDLQPTQYSIREFLGCGQPKAGRVNRLYVARYCSVNV